MLGSLKQQLDIVSMDETLEYNIDVIAENKFKHALDICQQMLQLTKEELKLHQSKLQSIPIYYEMIFELDDLKLDIINFKTNKTTKSNIEISVLQRDIEQLIKQIDRLKSKQIEYANELKTTLSDPYYYFEINNNKKSIVYLPKKK